jgi:predicted AlkP superfamily phosphohydrolase/phosphomutase
LEITRRVVVVGLDGATLDLIEPWAAEGHLLNMARILREGASARVGGLTPPIAAPAWSSFATGVNPGVHGVYDRIARVPGSYRFAPVTASDLRVPTLYDALSAAGRRVLLVNVPMTYPPPQINGYVISGSPAPSLEANISEPPGALEEARRASGDYWLNLEPGEAAGERGGAAFLDRLYRCTVLRMTAFEHLRKRESWDFAMVVFSGTDWVSRAMWKYMDPTHPLHDPAAPAAFQTAIRDQYFGMDRYVGRLMEIGEDDTTIVVMSVYGLGPLHAYFHVNHWLIEEGFMQLKRGALTALRRAAFAAGWTPAAVDGAAMRLGLGSLRRGQGENSLAGLFLSLDDVDWARTVAYAPGSLGQIRLNLAGREPAGVVRPEAFPRVRDEIMARLGALRDPATGERVVETVRPGEEAYAGPELAAAADILFTSRGGVYSGFGGYAFGAHAAIEPIRGGVSAAPRPDGVFLAWGPGAPQAGRLPSMPLTDLAPTLRHMLGVA